MFAAFQVDSLKDDLGVIVLLLVIICTALLLMPVILTKGLFAPCGVKGQYHENSPMCLCKLRLNYEGTLADA